MIRCSVVFCASGSRKCDDDSETSNWIAANTKECPKCNVTIEKDGGCNHMVRTAEKKSNCEIKNKIFFKFSGLQEPALQARLLLGVSWILGAAR